MKSKTSFFNKGIIFDDIRRFGWISIGYALALLFLMPLKILMLHSSKEIYKEQVIEIIGNMFYFNNIPSQGFLTLVVPILLATFLFRYIQVKNSTDMIHSLPIKRSTLYRSHVLVGILSLIIPVIIIAVISVFLNKTLALGQYYRIYDVVHWTGVTIIFDLLFFFACVFVGMIVGSSVLQGVLTVAALFLPIGLICLLRENLSVFLYGFIFNMNNSIEKLSPVTRIFEGFKDYNNIYHKMTVPEVTAYILICIILCFLGNFLYNKRKLEAATQAFAFKYLQYVFKYIATFVSMLIGGIYFQQTDKNLYWICFGFFICSIAGYFIAEMIIKKSIWIFKNIKGYGIYAAVIIVVMLGIKFDVIGYESKLPALDKVDSVCFTENIYNFNYEAYKDTELTDKKYLQSVQDFHKKLIEDKKINKYNRNGDMRDILLIYKLKDGSKVQRGYTISNKAYSKYLKPIYEAKEYKKIKYPIFIVDSSDIKKIQINPSYDFKKRTVITNPADIKEATEILKQDINNQNYEDMTDARRLGADLEFDIDFHSASKYEHIQNININRNEIRVNLPWNKSYKLFEEWLKKKGYVESLRILPKDVAYAVVEKVDNNKQWEEKLKNETLISGGNIKRLEITDKNQIGTCLESYKDGSRDTDAKYVIGFYRADKKSIDFGCFDEGSVPDFVRSYFSK